MLSRSLPTSSSSNRIRLRLGSVAAAAFGSGRPPPLSLTRRPSSTQPQRQRPAPMLRVGEPRMPMRLDSYRLGVASRGSSRWYSDEAASSSSTSSAESAPPSPLPPSPPPASASDNNDGGAGGGDAGTGSTNSNIREYSYPELTADAALHKAGLNDPEVPTWQNPLHHYNQNEWQKFDPSDFDSPAEFEASIVPAAPLATPNADGTSTSAPTPAHVQDLANEMVNLTVLEMNELVNKIADHYGFHEGLLSPDGSGGISGGGGAGDLDDDDDGAKPVVEEKTAFDVRLVAYDDKSKIKVIKEVRSLAGLGLKEAKELVEGAPKVVLRQVKKEEAEAIKAKLEELGATIEVV